METKFLFLTIIILLIIIISIWLLEKILDAFKGIVKIVLYVLVLLFFLSIITAPKEIGEVLQPHLGGLGPIVEEIFNYIIELLIPESDVLK